MEKLAVFVQALFGPHMTLRTPGRSGGKAFFFSVIMTLKAFCIHYLLFLKFFLSDHFLYNTFLHGKQIMTGIAVIIECFLMQAMGKDNPGHPALFKYDGFSPLVLCTGTGNDDADYKN